MALWEPVTCEHDVCYTWDIGPLSVYILNRDDEWHISVQRDQDVADGQPSEGRPVEKPEQAEWIRWIAPGSEHTVMLGPRMPDRPVVVRPENPLKISAGAEASFTVGIPLWIAVITGTDPKVQLCEEPVTVLSNTWFGEPVEGELCYSLTSRAMRSTELISRDLHRAVCPVHIHNKSGSELAFERLCLRVGELRLYSGPEGLVTSDVTVTYKGQDQKSVIKIGKKAPSGVRTALCVAEPRDISDSSVIRKSFSRIASYTGYGW